MRWVALGLGRVVAALLLHAQNLRCARWDEKDVDHDRVEVSEFVGVRQRLLREELEDLVEAFVGFVALAELSLLVRLLLGASGRISGRRRLGALVLARRGGHL